MPKKVVRAKTKIKTKVTNKKATGKYFFDHKAPDLPFWSFLAVCAMVLVVLAGTFAVSKRTTQPSPILPIIPIQHIKPIQTTTTITSATDATPIIVNNKLDIIYKNSVGGYSLNSYDLNLNVLDENRWLTNGQVIPNQQAAKPYFYNSTWYLAYIGGDRYLRLGTYDELFNRQREVTFVTPIPVSSNYQIYLTANANGTTTQVATATFKHIYTTNNTLGISGDRALGQNELTLQPYPTTKTIVIGTKQFEITESAGNTTITLKTT